MRFAFFILLFFSLVLSYFFYEKRGFLILLNKKIEERELSHVKYEISPIDFAKIRVREPFVYPLGQENGALIYNAQKFGDNFHLGDDFNGIGGYNSDYGDKVFSVASGIVVFTGTPSRGWGKVIVILHKNSDNSPIFSLYAHLSKIHFKVGELVSRGEVIGDVGNAKGKYYSHLHFEMRKGNILFIGKGYGTSKYPYINPEMLIVSD